jgi:hypothetical protein
MADRSLTHRHWQSEAAGTTPFPLLILALVIALMLIFRESPDEARSKTVRFGTSEFSVPVPSLPLP